MSELWKAQAEYHMEQANKWFEKYDKLRVALEFYADKTNLERFIWQTDHTTSYGDNYSESGLMDAVTKVAEKALKEK